MSISYSQKNFEKKNQIIALAITTIINTIFFLLMWQVKIWNDSPIPQSTTLKEPAAGEISFEQEPPSPEPLTQDEVMESPETEQVNTVPPLTSTVESPVTVKPSPPTESKVEKEVEPVVDLNLTMGKRSPRTTTGGSGSGSGSQAKTGGGNGKGIGSGNGEGNVALDWTFDKKILDGIDNGNEIGEITFFYRINEKGNVTEIFIKSTNVKLSLAERYKNLIKKTRFYPKIEGRNTGASGYRTIKIVPKN
jgi:hypothetical protein